MEEQTFQTPIVKYVYTLQDGSKELNIHDIKVRLGLSGQRVRGMLKNGTISRVIRTEPLNNSFNENESRVN